MQTIANAISQAKETLLHLQWLQQHADSLAVNAPPLSHEAWRITLDHAIAFSVDTNHCRLADTFLAAVVEHGITSLVAYAGVKEVSDERLEHQGLLLKGWFETLVGQLPIDHLLGFHTGLRQEDMPHNKRAERLLQRLLREAVPVVVRPYGTWRVEPEICVRAIGKQFGLNYAGTLEPWIADVVRKLTSASEKA